jgi:hypothetical protein
MRLYLRQLLKVFVQVCCPILVAVLIFRSWNNPSTSMSTPRSPKEVASALLAEAGLDLISLAPLQSLWAGYGQICHVAASPKEAPQNPSESSQSTSTGNYSDSLQSKTQSYILKLITPPPTKANDEGHTRKILSYQVEQYFYSHLAPKLPASVPVAKCIASINQHHPDGTSTTAMLLSDLEQEFPVAGEKRGALSPVQVNAAIDWLSGFHGFWWPRASEFDGKLLVRPPLDEVRQDGQDAAEKSVWLNGGYTYLATRLKEYKSLAEDDDSEWNRPLTDWVGDGCHSLSEMVAAFLAPQATGWGAISAYQTLIHGDVKSENLFTSKSGEQVAFYDFQYVGLGLGVCDLAKLFTCSVPLSMLVSSRDIPSVLAMQEGEKQLLERYWTRLKEVGKQEYEWSIFVRHWEVALVDWLRFQASWGFWGNTEVRIPLSSDALCMWLIITAVAGGACQEHLERPGVAGRSGWEFKVDWDVEVNANHEHL